MAKIPDGSELDEATRRFQELEDLTLELVEIADSAFPDELERQLGAVLDKVVEAKGLSSTQWWTIFRRVCPLVINLRSESPEVGFLIQELRFQLLLKVVECLSSSVGRIEAAHDL